MAAKFRPMLGAQGLWAGRDLYGATPAVTRDLGFSGLIRRTAPFSRLLRHAWGCGGPILTRILTGPLYFYIFAIISPWKWPMVIIWTNLNPLHPGMLPAKFGWNWPSGSGEEVENVKSLTDGQTDDGRSDICAQACMDYKQKVIN